MNEREVRQATEDMHALPLAFRAVGWDAFSVFTPGEE